MWRYVITFAKINKAQAAVQTFFACTARGSSGSPAGVLLQIGVMHRIYDAARVAADDLICDAVHDTGDLYRDDIVHGSARGEGYSGSGSACGWPDLSDDYE